MVTTFATDILATTSGNEKEIYQAITSASVVLTSTTIHMAITSAINNNKQKRLTPTANHMWFNIYHMAITLANNHVSTHNGITSTIQYVK